MTRQTRPTHGKCSRTMSTEELAQIRAALRSEGIPNYPDRIIAGPASAPMMKLAAPRRGASRT